MTKGRVALGFMVVAVIIVACLAGKIVDSVKSGTIVVKQAFYVGTMTAHSKEGVLWQWFGDLHTYPRSEHYYFSANADEGRSNDESINVTFKNGSTGNVTGSVRYSYPLIQDQMVAVHRRYTSDDGVRNDLVRTEMRKLINMTASLMSPEAAMTQKGLFYQMLTDQIENGQYKTRAEKEEYVDPVTKEKRYRDIVVPLHNEETGEIERMDNPFKEWNIVIDQVVIQQIDPDTTTKEMISKRRDAEMKVMVAKADVERAEQETKKVEAEGKKAVAEKEYAALQEKKTATINAQREKEVAEISAAKLVTVAELEKQESAIRLEKAKLDAKKKKELADAEAYEREKIMKADNALSVKVEAFKYAHKVWAEAHANRKVPAIMNGGSGGKSVDSNSAEFMDMINIWASKQLALDMGVDMNVNKSTK